MFSNKTIVNLVSTGGLILFASLAAAQTYTSVPVKYEDGWRLEFKDNSRLSFKKNQGKLVLEWKGVKHPWLSIKSQSVRADNFAAQKTTIFDDYSKEKYVPILKSWQKRKAIHDENEASRYAKDKLEYKDAKDKHEEDLLEWEKEKTHFDKEAKKNYHDEVDEYEKKRVKYRKDQEDDCKILCADKPVMPKQAIYKEAKPEKPPAPAMPSSFNEEEKPPNFAEHPQNYVLDRFGWWTIKLYGGSLGGRNTLDDEVEVEYLKHDNIYPRVIHARILKSSFSSDVAVQGEVVLVENAPSKVIGFGFKRYTINVILSGTGWERTIPDVPVRRVGMDFNFYKEDWGILGGPSLSIGLSSPGFDVSVINHNTKENVKGSIEEAYSATMGFKNYLKIMPNILWNVNMGIDRLNFVVTGGKAKTGLLSFNIDAGFQFIYKNIEFSLGQITYQPSSATFNSGCAREAQDAEGETYCLEGNAETETNSINIPAGTSLLMGVNYVF